MATVDVEEWIVHPKFNQRQTTAGEVLVDANTTDSTIIHFS